MQEGLVAVVGYAGVHGERQDAEEDWTGGAPARGDVQGRVAEPVAAVDLGRRAGECAGWDAVRPDRADPLVDAPERLAAAEPDELLVLECVGRAAGVVLVLCLVACRRRRWGREDTHTCRCVPVSRPSMAVRRFGGDGTSVLVPVITQPRT